MIIKCKKCGNEWDYAGNSKAVYIQCPRCRYNINIKKLKKEKFTERLNDDYS